MQADLIQPLLSLLGPAAADGRSEALHILSCLAADAATLDVLVESGLLTQVGFRPLYDGLQTVQAHESHDPLSCKAEGPCNSVQPYAGRLLLCGSRQLHNERVLPKR